MKDLIKAYVRKFDLIIGFLLLLLLFANAVWSVNTLVSDYNSLLSRFSKASEASLYNISDEFYEWFAHSTTNLQRYARYPDVVDFVQDTLREKNLSEELTFRFQTIYQDNFALRGFDSLMLVTPDGKSVGVGSSMKRRVSATLDAEKMALLQRAFRGNPAFVSSAEPVSPFFPADTSEAGVLAVPVYEKPGEVVAVLLARVSGEDLYRAISRIGEVSLSGASYILSGHGWMLAPSRFMVEQSRETGLSLNIGRFQSAVADAYLNADQTGLEVSEFLAAQGKPETPEITALNSSVRKGDITRLEYVDYRGVSVFGSWLYDPATDIWFVFQVNRDEALGGYRSLRSRVMSSLAFNVLLVALLLVLLFLLSSRNKRKIKGLAREKDRLVSLKDEELLAAARELEFQKRALDLHALVSIADAKGNIIYANDKFCELSGYAQNELIGSNHRILKSGKHDAAFYQDMWRTISRGEVWHGKVCNLAKDGSFYWVSSTILPLLDVAGKPERYISIRTDVTYLENVAASVKRLTELFAIASKGARVGVWDLDLKTNELYWNDQVSSLFGYQEGELDANYETFQRLIYPDDRQFINDAITASVEQGVPYEVEHRAVMADGSVRWFQEKGSVFYDDQGTPIRMSGVVQDVDVRKNAELELIDSETKLNALVNLSPTGIVQVSYPEGRFIRCNRSFQKMTGYTEEELRGLTYKDLTPAANDQLEDNRVYELERTGNFGPHEREYQTKEGEILPVRSYGVLTSDKFGNQLVWGIIQDISDWRNIERQLKSAIDKAEHASNAKSVFLSRVSHELRTPLNAIIGLSQLIQHDSTLSDSSKTNINSIFNSGNHLLDLVNDLLDLGKIEADKLEVSLRPIRLQDLLDVCVEMNRPLADKRDIRLHYNPSDFSGVAVYGDEIRVKQVIINLLTNAIKYNNPRGQVFVEPKELPSGRFGISVRDTGIGVSSEKLEQLFEPFERLDASHSDIEGTGIGLMISRKLARSMMGELNVQSQSGAGSVFTLELQHAELVQDLPEQITLIQNRVAESEEEVRSYQGKLLIAEDNVANRMVMEQQMKLLGVSVEFAVNGLIALEKWRSGNYAMMLTDVSMPELDGFELVKRIRKEELQFGKHIPILAITANSLQVDRDRCMAVGMDGFIGKPVVLNQLRQALNKWWPVEAELSEAIGQNIDSSAIDIRQVELIVGRDRAKHCKLFLSYVDYSPATIAEIAEDIDVRDRHSVIRKSNRLGATSKMIGAIRIAATCDQLEISAASAHWDEVQELFGTLKRHFEDVRLFVQAYCRGN